MIDPEKEKLSEKTGFNCLVGLIGAIGVISIAVGVFDKPLATPLLTTGVTAIVIAFFLAVYRSGRK